MDNVRLAPGPAIRLATGALGGAIGRLAPGALLDPARAPGPLPEATAPTLDSYAPPAPKAPPGGVFAQADDTFNAWWSIPVVVFGGCIILALLARLGVAQVRRYQPRPAAPD